MRRARETIIHRGRNRRSWHKNSAVPRPECRGTLPWSGLARRAAASVVSVGRILTGKTLQTLCILFSLFFFSHFKFYWMQFTLMDRERGKMDQRPKRTHLCRVEMRLFSNVDRDNSLESSILFLYLGQFLFLMQVEIISLCGPPCPAIYEQDFFQRRSRYSLKWSIFPIHLRRDKFFVQIQIIGSSGPFCPSTLGRTSFFNLDEHNWLEGSILPRPVS